jgi:cytochrome c-type biogenesis protein CcmF
VLLFLTGVGPLLAWRRATLANLWQQFLWPTVASVVTAAGMAWLGIAFWSSGLCFALCAFVTITITQEFWRGARVRQSATHTDVFTALVGLFARSKRRYGGYIVHIGIVLIFLGFAGNGSKREEDVPDLKPGQQVVLAPYTVRYVSLNVTDDGEKQMVTAHIEALRDGQPVGGLYPAKWFFRNHESEPTTEVAMRRGLADDLYLVLAAYNVESQTAVLKIVVNPLVNWIWMGVGIMVFGSIIALLPERSMAFATSKVPQAAVTTSVVLLLLVAGGVASLGAQHIEAPQTVLIVPKSPVEKELQTAIICMCGTCGRKRVGECTCELAGEMRKEIAGLVAAGQSRDEIIAHFIQKYGSQEVLSEPIDQGFNRLAWLLPYLVGGAGIGVVGGMAVRWSRRARHDSPADAGPAADSALQTKLDDELRDLD